MSEHVDDLLAGALAVSAGNDDIAFLVDEEQVGYHTWLGTRKSPRNRGLRQLPV